MNNYPGNEEVGNSPRDYVGQSVSLGGTIVTTNPIVVKIKTQLNRSRLRSRTSREVSEANEISVFGTLEDESTLAVERATVRELWERYYMYIVSFIGGLWVLGRIGQHWRFDRDRSAFVP